MDAARIYIEKKEIYKKKTTGLIEKTCLRRRGQKKEGASRRMGEQAGKVHRGKRNRRTASRRRKGTKVFHLERGRNSPSNEREKEEVKGEVLLITVYHSERKRKGRIGQEGGL